MAKVRSITVTISDKQASQVKDLAVSSGLAVEAFLGAVVAEWMGKAKKFQRFAGKYLKNRKRAERKVAAKLKKSAKPAKKSKKAAKVKAKPAPTALRTPAKPQSPPAPAAAPAPTTTPANGAMT